MALHTLDGAAVAGRRVLLRADLNVPMKDGVITDPTRLEAVLPTIRELAGKGARVIVASHFDRPKGKAVAAMSLAPIAAAMGRALGAPVAFAADCVGEAAATVVAGLAPGGVAVLENTRFHSGEEQNDPDFARALAVNADLFVNDAFSAAHRAHASTEGVAHLLPACAGRLMQAEIEALTRALENPARPVAAVVGGAKVSTKLELLGNLLAKVDALVIGGAMANTFLAAQGRKVGRSLQEAELHANARDILAAAARRGCKVLLPLDAVIASEFRAHPPTQVVGIDRVPDQAMILDVGPASIAALEAELAGWKTVLWNGPLGAFETPPFDTGTNAFARAVAAAPVLSVAGGGDTVAALKHAGVEAKFGYVSLAGGAFLEWLEGKTLPGVAALMD